MVSPAAKLVESESEGGAPDKAVAPVIGAEGGPALLLTALPVAVPGSKKSCPASTAEAATSVVLASFPIAVFSAAFKLPAVVAGELVGGGSIKKFPAGGGFVVVAVNWTEAVVPSGRLKVRLT